jgi:hypothetical protein
MLMSEATVVDGDAPSLHQPPKPNLRRLGFHVEKAVSMAMESEFRSDQLQQIIRLAESRKYGRCCPRRTESTIRGAVRRMGSGRGTVVHRAPLFTADRRLPEADQCVSEFYAEIY